MPAQYYSCFSAEQALQCDARRSSQRRCLCMVTAAVPQRIVRSPVRTRRFCAGLRRSATSGYAPGLGSSPAWAPTSRASKHASRNLSTWVRHGSEQFSEARPPNAGSTGRRPRRGVSRRSRRARERRSAARGAGRWPAGVRRPRARVANTAALQLFLQIAPDPLQELFPVRRRLLHHPAAEQCFRLDPVLLLMLAPPAAPEDGDGTA
jgi:hypothetical protein